MADADRQGGWGPERKPGAVSITFDNLGEAADLEFGLWPEGRPIGQHYSVTEALPPILDMLDGVPATFFVEAWNVDRYPDAIRTMAAHGNEIGLHGWRHEIWDKVDENARPALIDRCLGAFASLDLRPRGFRPPGGGATADLQTILHARGFRYHSSVGDAPGVDRGVAALPFAFPDIDGFQIEHGMGGPAEEGESEDHAIRRLGDHIRSSLDTAVTAGTHRMLIFHPFIIGKSAKRLAALSEILGEIRQRADVWLARSDAVADFLLGEGGPSIQLLSVPARSG